MATTKDTQKKPDQTKAYDLEIKQHYDKVAEADKDSSTSTMADIYVREHETQFIEQQIKDFTQQQNNQYFVSGNYPIGSGKDNKLSILDVGCGNGYTLENISNKFPDCCFQGVEFNDSLREIANQRFTTTKNVSITKGDIRNINSLPKEKFDTLICQR